MALREGGAHCHERQAPPIRARLGSGRSRDPVPIRRSGVGRDHIPNTTPFSPRSSSSVIIGLSSLIRSSTRRRQPHHLPHRPVTPPPSPWVRFLHDLSSRGRDHVLALYFPGQEHAFFHMGLELDFPLRLSLFHLRVVYIILTTWLH
jgi:hypothetical protein